MIYFLNARFLLPYQCNASFMFYDYFELHTYGAYLMLQVLSIVTFGLFKVPDTTALTFVVVDSLAIAIFGEHFFSVYHWHF
jgi:hypothetical protein